MTTNRLEDLPDCLTVAEAACLLRVSKSTLYEALKSGEVAGLRIRGRVVIPKKAVIAMIDRAAEGRAGAGDT